MTQWPSIPFGFLCAALLVACDKKDEQSAAIAASSAALSAAVAKAPPADVKLSEGDPAPSVSLPLHDGKQTQVASYKGKYLVLYFYPKDDTAGCTAQAQGLRDSYRELQAFDVQVLGVSTQDAESHQAFIDKHSLPFPLVVDTEHAVADAFGVPVKMGFAARQTFLIGPTGTIEKIWRDVDPKEHAQAILDIVVTG